MELLGFFNVGPTEMVVLAIVAVLLFGKRLPEVGRSLGKGIIEFKKGLQGVEDDINSAAHKHSSPWRAAPDEPPAISNAPSQSETQSTPDLEPKSGQPSQPV